MRADERQAAAAYAYAWWMTGDEDAASTALGAALATPEPDKADDSTRLAALMTGVREALGDLRTMPPTSELALLHDGFDVPLDVAARLAGVATDGAALALATGRLEALLETVRDDFRHTEHLGGLAIGDPEALAHAADCHSCRKAHTLIERGRVELREVSPVSAPPGMLARMVAEHAPPTPAPTDPAPAHEQDDDAPSVEELEAMLRVEAPAAGAVAAPPAEAPPVEAPPVGAPDGTPPDEIPPAEAPASTGAPAPPEAEPEAEPGAEPAEARPAPARVPTSPGRRRAAALLAGAGVLTLVALGGILLTSDDTEDEPGVEVSEEPVVTRSEATEVAEPSAPPEEDPTTDPFGPPIKGRGFAVVAAGLLLSGETELSPSGASIGPHEPLRVAVDYANGSKGVQLNAVWRVGNRVFERLETVVSSRASRHVWGLPVPAEGWPPGRHRIVITTKEGLAGSIDFTIRESD